MLDFVIYHLFLALGVMLTLFLITQILRDRRPPAASLAWLLFIVSLPYIAIPLYLTIGVRKLKFTDKSALYGAPTHSDRTSPVPDLDQLLDSYGVPEASGGNQVVFHADGNEARQALWHTMDSALKQLDIAIFILANDTLGKQVCEKLRTKAQQGVRVRLLLDGVGSFLLPRHQVRKLQASGIEVLWFIPVLHRPFKGRTNLRNHRKLVLADSQRIWTGGRNLAHEYFDSAGEQGQPWLDLSFHMQGAGIIQYQELFEEDWRFAGGQTSVPATFTDPLPSGESRTRLLPSGPDMPDDPLQALLLAACFEARNKIIAVTPYFIPDDPIIEGLCLAARRGVSVTLILPEKSNHLLPDIARNRYLRELTDSGATVVFLPGIMNHAKALVVDQRLAVSGSANLDLRSLYLNFEAMTLFYSQDDILWLTRWMENLISQGFEHHPVTPGRMCLLIEGVVVMLSFQL
ncbi:phospholipase D-like domain-containing protein [Thiolapillus brandeum]|uniref:Cardiolipin synthase n=1 Tax=Thiolapillus brandeum TaxID=1076588 RepID=A0A7U6JIZ2_9GAMM|nr:phospholipase D-like domain-containing protein [Thiolapillus brandeum]BAO44680.1 cardiolipin synthase [Thiolapillus brandeum]